MSYNSLYVSADKHNAKKDKFNKVFQINDNGYLTVHIPRATV